MLGVDGRRGAGPHADHRPRDVLEPLPRGVLGQGRHLRPPAVRPGGPPRLRRRHPAGQGRPGRRGLPHRRPHLLRRRPAAPDAPMAERRAAPSGRSCCSAWRRRAPGRGRGRSPAVEGSRSAASGGQQPAHAVRRARCRWPPPSALVVLACWGVVLVTRGRVRRAVAGLARRRRRGSWPRVVGVVQAPDAVPRRAGRLVGVADRGRRHTAGAGWRSSARVLSPSPAVLAVRLAPAGPRWAAGTTPRQRAPTPAVPPEEQPA